MDLTDHVVQQGAEADRREVNPTIQVETATLPRLSGPASPGPTGLGLVEKEQCFSCTTAEDDLVAVAARRRQPQPRFGVCGPHNGDYPDPGRISMIKRASAARKVATSEGSRPGASLFSNTASAGWPGSAGPAHQRHREGAVSTATGGISGELCSCVDHHRDGDGAVATGEAFDQREGVRVATDEAGPVRCGPGRVVVPAVRVSTEGRARSSPRSRWAASR
jgi:hypothetical protein